MDSFFRSRPRGFTYPHPTRHRPFPAPGVSRAAPGTYNYVPSPQQHQPYHGAGIADLNHPFDDNRHDVDGDYQNFGRVPFHHNDFERPSTHHTSHQEASARRSAHQLPSPNVRAHPSPPPPSHRAQRYNQHSQYQCNPPARPSRNVAMPEKYIYPCASQHFQIHVTSVKGSSHTSFIAIIPFAATIDNIESTLIDPACGPSELVVRMRDGSLVALDDVKELREVVEIIVRQQQPWRARPNTDIDGSERSIHKSSASKIKHGFRSTRMGDREMGSEQRQRVPEKATWKRQVPGWMRFASGGGYRRGYTGR